MAEEEISKKELSDLYWKREFSTPQIANLLGRSRGYVWKLMAKYKIPRRSISEACKGQPSPKRGKGHKYIYDLSKLANENDGLGYFIGLLLSDGHINLKTYHIDFAFKNEDVLEFKRNIETILDISPPLTTYLNGDGTCAFSIYNAKIGSFLHIYYGIPLGKKGEFGIPKKIVASENLSFLGGFLRGTYEGDGSAGVYTENRQCTFCGNISFIKDLKALLSRLGIYTGRVRIHSQSKKLYVLGVSSRSFQKLYILTYEKTDLYLTRKRERFKEVVNQAGKRVWVDEEIAYLKINHKRESDQTLGRLLNRSIYAIRHKRLRLGLKRE